MAPPRVAVPEARFVLGMFALDLDLDDEGWTPLHEITVEAWLAALAAKERVTCCSLQGGFEIRADGVWWNEGAIDEIKMASTWLDGVLTLLAGGRTTGVWAWEESSMTLDREGDLVEMYDVHHSGNVVCRPVVFTLDAFARTLLEATRPWITFRAAALDRLDGHPHAAVIRENLSYDWARAAEAIAARLGAPIPEPPEGALLPDPPLCKAVLTGDLERFRDILGRSPEEVSRRTRRGATALHVAIDHRREVYLEPLLEAGADPSWPAEDGDTPLHRAAWRGVPAAMVEALLARGARLDALDRRGWTPLQVAALTGMHARSATLADLLLARGAALDVLSALALGRFEKLPPLLDAAPVPGDAVPLLVTRARGLLATAGAPEVKAILREHLAALDLLLARGAAIDATGSVFIRPGLAEARNSGREDLVEALVARGAR